MVPSCSNIGVPAAEMAKHTGPSPAPGRSSIPSGTVHQSSSLSKAEKELEVRPLPERGLAAPGLGHSAPSATPVSDLGRTDDVCELGRVRGVGG